MTDLMHRARVLERLGFDGIWVGDSIGRASWPIPDALIWLTAAAAATDHIELGTSIVQVPLRHPVELAQRLLSMHAVCGGRFTAGLGSGSSLPDFRAVGVPFEQRFRLLAEGLPTIRRVLRGERVGDAFLPSWTDQGSGPKILVGSWYSGIWVRRAAEDYDGWIASAMFTSFNQLQEGINRFRDAGGGRAMVGTITVDFHAEPTKWDPDGRFNLVCSPAEATERMQRLAELGYDDALLTRANHAQPDVSEEDLAAMRSLVPR